MNKKQSLHKTKIQNQRLAWRLLRDALGLYPSHSIQITSEKQPIEASALFLPTFRLGGWHSLHLARHRVVYNQ